MEFFIKGLESMIMLCLSNICRQYIAIYTWEGGLKPKSTSGTLLGGWGSLEAGYLFKNKKVRNNLWLTF